MDLLLTVGIQRGRGDSLDLLAPILEVQATVLFTLGGLQDSRVACLRGRSYLGPGRATSATTGLFATFLPRFTRMAAVWQVFLSVRHSGSSTTVVPDFLDSLVYFPDFLERQVLVSVSRSTTVGGVFPLESLVATGGYGGACGT